MAISLSMLFWVAVLLLDAAALLFVLFVKISLARAACDDDDSDPQWIWIAEHAALVAITVWATIWVVSHLSDLLLNS